jgi:hypothetical protein
VFSRLLKKPDQLSFCKRCGLPFKVGRKVIYCSKECGKVDSGLASTNKHTRVRNQVRIKVASEVLVHWLEKPSGLWRIAVESALRERNLTDARQKTSQWLGTYINAASASEDSKKRKRLVELCSTSDSESERQLAVESVDKLCALIRKAQMTEKELRL